MGHLRVSRPKASPVRPWAGPELCLRVGHWEDRTSPVRLDDCSPQSWRFWRRRSTTKGVIMLDSTELAHTPAPRPATPDPVAKILPFSDASTRTKGQRVMRLADFILTNRDAILAEWLEFAKTCSPAGGSMSIVALSDHANEMLTVIAQDLKTPQGGLEQSEKSKGNAPAPDTNKRTAAEKHGTGRAESGFTIDEMVAEYRALRASVIRLWTKEQGDVTHTDLEDLTRFNEAIDQSLTESVERFTKDLDKSKEMFLAMLGHDLRTPIGAVMTSAKFMLETKELTEPHLTLTTRIASATDTAAAIEMTPGSQLIGRSTRTSHAPGIRICERYPAMKNVKA